MLTVAQRQSRGQALAEAFFFRMDQELVAIGESDAARSNAIDM